MEQAFTSIIYTVCLVLMIICGVIFVRDVKKVTKEQMANKVIRVICRKCGNTFEGTQDSLQMGFMHKEVSHTKTQIKGSAAVNIPNYTSYARKVYCPYCQSRQWADIPDVNEIGAENRKVVGPCVVRLVVSLLVINFVAAIFNKLVGIIF